MAFSLDSPEIPARFCICGSWRCTSGDAAGQIACEIFMAVGMLATIVNALKNRSSLRVDSQGTSRHANTVLKYMKFVLLSACAYNASCNNFSMLSEVSHPLQCDAVQWIGSVLLVSGGIGWALVHWDLGRNWSPVPQMLQDHQLVTRGVYRLARHPMYAVFAWMLPAIAIATMDWVRVVCWLIFVVILTSRIPEEEGIPLEKFGDQYVQYRRDVGALGPRWCCYWYNKEIVEARTPMLDPMVP